MGLRAEVKELLVESGNDGYGVDEVEAERALDRYEEANGKIDNEPVDSDIEEIAETVYSQRKYWSDNDE